MKTILGILLWIFVICGAKADGPPNPPLPPPHVHTDGSDWIRQGKHLNNKGESCCGLHDCTEIDGSGITTRPDGYYIKGLRETVPYSEAKRSEDGKYWRCQWGGERKCFFAPPPSI